MRRVFRAGFAVLLAGLLVFGGICGCKDEGKPNPDLKVPDIPPGGKGSKNLKPPGG